MKHELAQYLRCPVCRNRLDLAVEREARGEVMEGALACRGCPERFAIKNYIPLMLPAGHPHQEPDTVELWGFQWTCDRLNRQTRYYDDDFLELEFSQWHVPEEWFPGKMVLDAGCGNGRHSLILNRLGCRVFAIDLSGAIEAMLFRPEFEGVHLIRGDIALPPFEEGFFDLVLARQVLQHTEDPPRTIGELAKITRPGGYFVGSMYMTPERSLARMKIRLIDLLRRLMRPLPRKFIYYFTWLSVPLYKYRPLRPLGRIFFIRSRYDDSDAFTWNLNHDQYITSYQATYTREETRRFFRDAGLCDLVESTEWPNMYRAVRRP